jgi:hypothetical protein
VGLRTRRSYPVSKPVAAFFARWVRRPTARRLAHRSGGPCAPRKTTRGINPRATVREWPALGFSTCAAAWFRQPTPTLPKATGSPTPRLQKTSTSQISSKIRVLRLPPEQSWGIIYSGIGLVTVLRYIIAFSPADRHAADAKAGVGFFVLYPPCRTGWMHPGHQRVLLTGTQTRKKTATSVGGGFGGVLAPLTARLRGTT